MSKLTEWLNRFNKNKGISAATILVLLISSGLFVYFTGGIKYVYSHSMYLPIVFSAVLFKTAGGVAAGLLGGIILGPYMPIDTITGEKQLAVNWLFRMGAFILVGCFVGYAIEILQSTNDALVRKIKEQALKEKEENLLTKRFSLAADHSRTVIWEVDPQGLYTYISSSCESVFGYTPDELVGKRTFFDLRPENGPEEHTMKGLELLQAGEPLVHLDNPIQKRDGTLIWVSTSGSPIYDDKDHLIGFRGVDYDITERKKTEEELRKFRTVSDQANYGTAIATLDGSLVYVNKTFAKMHHWPMEELIGQNLSALHNEEQLPQVSALLDKLKSMGGLMSQEVWRIKRDKTPFPSLISAHIIVDHSNRPQLMSATIIDITEMKQKETELNKLTLAIEQSSVAIVITDLDATILYVSPAFERITGYAGHEVIGQRASILKSGHTNPAVYQNLWDTISEGSLWQGEWLNKKKNEELYWESITITPIFDDKNVMTSYLAVKEDISKRKLVEELQQESNTRAQQQRSAVSQLVLDDAIIEGRIPESMRRISRMVAEALHVAQASIWLLSSDGEELQCLSNYILKQKRYTQGAVLKKTAYPRYFATLHTDKRINAEDAQNDPRTRELAEQYLAPHGITSMLDEGIVLEGELAGVVCLEHIGETRKWHSDEEFFIGTMASMIAQILANVKRKQVEEALGQSEKQFRSLFMESPVSMLIQDKDTSEILEANPTACKFYGCSSLEELINYNHWYGPPYTSDEALAWVRKAVKEGPQQFEWLGRKVNGELIWLNVNLSLLEIQGITRVLASSIDITEQKKTEQIRIAKEAAEEANRAKSAFLSNMSHEIRTPLNAIIGFAQILQKDPSLNPKQEEQVQTILRSGEHLMRLINNILDISKIEAGHIKVKPTNLCIDYLMKDLDLMFSLRAKEKGLKLSFEVQESAPQNVLVDEDKLRQIIVNLLGNAIKFTKTGSISVRVWAETTENHERDISKDSDNLNLLIEVEDTGVGIASEYKARIFDAFCQGGEENIASGTGLGLAISKNLVELMGGRLAVESQLGEGSAFRFSVPVKVSDSNEKETRKLDQVVGLEQGVGPFRVLVVDDIADNRNIACQLLEPIGFEVQEAENGEQAIELVEVWEPHAVLMDMRMPVMDGYEATRRIKSAKRGSSTLVIALTASAFDTDIERVFSSGIDAYISKPFRSEQLFAALSKIPGLRYRYASPVSQDLKGSTDQTMTPEDIASLPVELVQAMRRAVERGEMRDLRELIAKAKSVNADVAKALLVLAKQYDYEKLSQILER